MGHAWPCSELVVLDARSCIHARCTPTAPGGVLATFAVLYATKPAEWTRRWKRCCITSLTARLYRDYGHNVIIAITSHLSIERLDCHRDFKLVEWIIASLLNLNNHLFRNDLYCI